MDYAKALREGIEEVFQTMVLLPLERAAEPMPGTDETSEVRVTGMIGLGGAIKGVLAVHATANMAKSVTAALLGMEVAEIDDDVKDAFGEIANMLAGCLKVSATEAGIAMQLAIPSAVFGETVHFGGLKSATRVVERYDGEDGWLLVELKYLEG